MGKPQGKIYECTHRNEVFKGDTNGKGELIFADFKLSSMFKGGKRCSEKVTIVSLERGVKLLGKLPLDADNVRNEIKIQEIKLRNYSIKCLVQIDVEDF